MQYVTVFDASSFPYRNLSFLVPGLILLLVGAIPVIKPEWLEAIFRRSMKGRWIFRWFFLLFALTWTVGAGASIMIDANNARHSMRAHGCQIVEGRVDHFHPMPYNGHDEETFDVNGVKFWYSDYIITAGFNNTASHGGPIRQGLPVRICQRDGEILRLEVAGQRPLVSPPTMRRVSASGRLRSFRGVSRNFDHRDRSERSQVLD